MVGGMRFFAAWPGSQIDVPDDRRLVDRHVQGLADSFLSKGGFCVLKAQ